MTDRQARVCVYCAASAMALSFATLVLVIIFSIGFQQTLYAQSISTEREISGLTKWAIAVYEKLDASGCIISPIPKVPNKEK